MTAEQRPPAPAANDEQTALANLKALLIGPEQAEIKRLKDDTRDPAIQTERVAGSLPESLHRAYAESPQVLTRAMEAPVSACIEDSVRRNPGFFADILFPVMGPAIRRSIAQALKGLVQQINQTLEHSLTIKGLKWRLEAARTGVPFAEVVLRHTLRFRVEEVFLIQSGSGLLIQHLSQRPVAAKDADAVSAMLTAIRDFASDTLRDDDDDDNSRLETVDIGDHTLWLAHGPRAYLACAIRGLPPVSLRDQLSAVIEEIHQRHTYVLDVFDGDAAIALPVIPLLERCLVSETEPAETWRTPWSLLLVLLILVGLLGWWAQSWWQKGALANQEKARITAAAQALVEAPGVVVTDRRIEDNRLIVRGLHDPLTEQPAAILQRAGLTPGDYSLSFQAFQSTHPSAAQRRAAQRLAPPPGVTLSLDDQGVLKASGGASSDWVEKASLLATTVPGITAFDAQGVTDRDRRLERELRAALQPPDSVSIVVQDGRAAIEGSAPLAWVRALDDAIPELPGLTSVDTASLLASERQRLDHLVALIDQANIHFVDGIDIGASQRQRIASVAALIGETQQHASDLGLNLKLQIIGRTDGTGTVEQNHFVASQRAEKVAAALQQSGHPMPPLQLRAVTQPADVGDAPDAGLRRVEFKVIGIPSA